MKEAKIKKEFIEQLIIERRNRTHGLCRCKCDKCVKLCNII